MVREETQREIEEAFHRFFIDTDIAVHLQKATETEDFIFLNIMGNNENYRLVLTKTSNLQHRILEKLYRILWGEDQGNDIFVEVSW